MVFPSSSLDRLRQSPLIEVSPANHQPPWAAGRTSGFPRTASSFNYKLKEGRGHACLHGNPHV